jgi:hypothetical protein
MVAVMGRSFIILLLVWLLFFRIVKK